MPERKTLEKSRKARREGKAPSTQAGAFVEEEIEHIREGKHGARSTKQAIAIGLSKARRAGVKLPPPPKSASDRTKRSAKSAAKSAARGRKGRRPSPARSRAAKAALKDEPRSTASRTALSRQATRAARRRPARARSASARRAAKTRSAAKR